MFASCAFEAVIQVDSTALRVSVPDVITCGKIAPYLLSESKSIDFVTRRGSWDCFSQTTIWERMRSLAFLQ